MYGDHDVVDFLRDLINKKDQRIMYLESELSRVMAIFELDRELSVQAREDKIKSKSVAE